MSLVSKLAIIFIVFGLIITAGIVLIMYHDDVEKKPFYYISLTIITTILIIIFIYLIWLYFIKNSKSNEPLEVEKVKDEIIRKKIRNNEISGIVFQDGSYRYNKDQFQWSSQKIGLYDKWWLSIKTIVKTKENISTDIYNIPLDDIKNTTSSNYDYLHRCEKFNYKLGLKDYPKTPDIKHKLMEMMYDRDPDEIRNTAEKLKMFSDLDENQVKPIINQQNEIIKDVKKTLPTQLEE